jgi:hypothetical protein
VTLHVQSVLHKEKLCNILRHVNHIRDLRRNFDNGINTDPSVVNRTLRIQWMRNIISDDVFKRKLQQHEKKRIIDHHKTEILHTFSCILKGICQKIMVIELSDVNIETQLVEYETSKLYTKECFNILRKRSNMKMPCIEIA